MAQVSSSVANLTAGMFERARGAETSHAPSFVCIGAQKAGTRSLFDRISAHADSLMPPIKELHYLDAEMSDERLKKLRKRLRFAERQGDNSKYSKEQQEFLRRWISLVRRGNADLKNYGSLWAPFGNKLCGDITPSYATMGESKVAAFAAAYPDTKIVMILREPLARMWSQLRMIVRFSENEDADILSAERVQEMCNSAHVQNRSRQSEAVVKWKKHCGANFKSFFFDDLTEQPEQFYADIFNFIGLDPDPKLVTVPPDFNRKSRPMAELPQQFAAIALQSLEGEYENLADLVGGHARTWLNNRPELHQS